MANSEAVRADTLESEGVAEGKVCVIHNGLEPMTSERPASPVLRDALGLGGGPVALVVANLIPYKGHACFLVPWIRDF